MKTPPTPEQVTGQVLTATAPFRVQLLRLLSMLGLLAASLGTADFTGLLPILPEGWDKWLVTIGLFAASIKQGILWLGDLLDNGKQDGSFKLPLLLLLCVSSLFIFSSCMVGIDGQGNWQLRPDPKSVDATLSYFLRQAPSSSKDASVEWEYYDADGNVIPPEQYDAYGIKP